MAYTTYTRVASEFKDITFSSTSSVTDTEVGTFIGEIDEYIDARIGGKYSTPISDTTSPKSYKILTMISTAIVAEKVRRILEVKDTPSAEASQDGFRPVLSANEAKKMIEQIRKGELILSDATLLSGGDGFKSYNYDNDIEFEFDVTKDNW